eukprot:scaffold18417_cov79-Skeletonema_dohrnii-CCMP3373.AAC.4
MAPGTEATMVYHGGWCGCRCVFFDCLLSRLSRAGRPRGGLFEMTILMSCPSPTWESPRNEIDFFYMFSPGQAELLAVFNKENSPFAWNNHCKKWGTVLLHPVQPPGAEGVAST